ncbi:MAG: DUF1285 domain-containing protein [Rhodospirillales bacterium]|nr:DUF1285 domain-containing protein [Rhodospirillales bacterium]
MNKNTDQPISLSLPTGGPPGTPGETPHPGPQGIQLKASQTVCGDLDMRIDKAGVWYHEGTPIGRKELVRLFSTVLKRDEAGDYWLITPAEAGRIAVEDAPFIAVELSCSGDGIDQVLSFRTNVDDNVTVDVDHPIRVDTGTSGPTSGPRPYVVMDGGLEARIARPVYYELVALGHEEKTDHGKKFGVRSSGVFFPLGQLDEER